MNGITSAIIASVSTISAAAIGFWSAYFIQRKSRKQTLIDSILEKRMSIYSEALDLIYDTEQNRTKPEELDRIADRWRKWFPSNAAYLPPSVNDAVFAVITSSAMVSVDLHNRETDSVTIRHFKDVLQDAKMKLMNRKDICWLPEDLK